MGNHTYARRFSRKRRLARWLGLLAAPFLAGGCFAFPPAEIAQLAPRPRHGAGLSPYRYPGAEGRPIEGFLALPSGPAAPGRSPFPPFPAVSEAGLHSMFPLRNAAVALLDSAFHHFHDEFKQALR